MLDQTVHYFLIIIQKMLINLITNKQQEVEILKNVLKPVHPHLKIV